MSSILLRGSLWLRIWKTLQLPLCKPPFGKVAVGTFEKEVTKYFSSSYISCQFSRISLFLSTLS